MPPANLARDRGEKNPFLQRNFLEQDTFVNLGESVRSVASLEVISQKGEEGITLDRARPACLCPCKILAACSQQLRRYLGLAIVKLSSGYRLRECRRI